MKAKNYKLKAEDMVELVAPMGGCLATDKITVDGLPVKYMYREEPDGAHDGGWRFLSGTETQEYIDDAEIWHSIMLIPLPTTTGLSCLI